ncbi:MAG TPA: lytic transglycosylase domain-containing protein [Pyrinomonadaceae bacterium]|nr:lytic transglycosylase domain-containing protein [Pyrinomonadaceae bacterium]
MNQFPKLLCAALLVFACTVAASAQTRKKGAARPAAPAAAQVEEAVSPDQFRLDFIKASEGYKASLEELAGTLEESLKKADERHAQLVELYKDGLIARREIEGSEKNLTEARARIESTRGEIATVEATIAAAKNPPPPPRVPVAEVASLSMASPAWTTGNRGIDGLIRLYGNRYGVDPYLIYCVMHQESAFRSGAVSHKGATGLMQLMPGTAARYGVTNMYDPAQSIMGGTRYLKDLMRLFNGRVDLVLAGYNAGEGAVMRYGYRVPPYRETRDYVQRIGTRYAAGRGVTLTGKSAARRPEAKKK